MVEKYFLGEISLNQLVDWVCNELELIIMQECAKYGINR